MFQLSWPRPYQEFGFDHLLILSFVFGLCVYLFWLGLKNDFNSKLAKQARFVLGYGLIALLVVYNTFHIFIARDFNFTYNLPLQLSSAAAYFSLIVCFYPKRQLFWILYFWGLISASITLLLPDLRPNEGVGTFRHLEMMLSHALIVWVIFSQLPYFWKSLKAKYFLLSTGILLAYSVLIGQVVNPTFGANYMFLAKKPEGGQMDFLPIIAGGHALSLTIFVILVMLVQYLATKYLIQRYK